RLRVAHGDISERLAVDVDLGQLQAVDEPAVADVVEPARRVDALDPELAHLALAGPTVPERVVPGVHHRFVGGPERAAPVAVVALGLVQYGAVLLLGMNATLDACHL